MVEPPLPSKIHGKTFSHAFGTATNALETFLLKRKMMGPSWIQIKNAQLMKPAISWCKLEAKVTDQKEIRVFAEGEEGAPKESPPLCVMSLSIRTVFENGINEIVAASAFIYDQGKTPTLLHHQTSRSNI
jgi:DNA polymerase alpha subunit A